MKDKNLVIISGAVVFKDQNGLTKWFLVKQNEEDGWEIPKVIIRKGESSVRGALRLMGEKGSMTTRVLEEAGRAGGVATVNGKTRSQRYLYYLMLMKVTSGEPIGFEDYQWLDYAQSMRKIKSKREKTMLKDANVVMKQWKKERAKRRKKAKELSDLQK